MRADVVLGPYGILRVRIGTYDFVTLYRTGGASPSPTLRRRDEGAVGRAERGIGPYRGAFYDYFLFNNVSLAKWPVL